MADDNGNKMIENVTREALADALKSTEPAEPAPEKQIPEGCVSRTLSFRDRNMIMGAVRAYVQGEKGKYKGQFKVERIKKVISFDETIEYFEMMNDAQAETLFTWQEARQAYVSWRMMRGGMMKVEEFAKQFPNLDLDTCPTKPPVKQPALTPDEQRGKPRVFYIPSKLDGFIQDALQDYQWNSAASDSVAELLDRFGIKDE